MLLNRRTSNTLQLHHLGKDYPDPSYNFQKRLRGCFTATSGKITNDEEMQAAINKADFVKKEVEALIFLSKYRSSARFPSYASFASLCLTCSLSVKRRYGPDAQQ